MAEQPEQLPVRLLVRMSRQSFLVGRPMTTSSVHHHSSCLEAHQHPSLTIGGGRQPHQRSGWEQQRWSQRGQGQ